MDRAVPVPPWGPWCGLSALAAQGGQAPSALALAVALVDWWGSWEVTAGIMLSVARAGLALES